MGGDANREDDGEDLLGGGDDLLANCSIQDETRVALATVVISFATRKCNELPIGTRTTEGLAHGTKRGCTCRFDLAIVTGIAQASLQHGRPGHSRSRFQS